MPKQYRQLVFTNFAKEVAKRLIDLNKTKSELCKDMGISACYLNDLLKGNRDCPERKQQIVEILELDESVLREGV